MHDQYYFDDRTRTPHDTNFYYRENRDDHRPTTRPHRDAYDGDNQSEYDRHHMDDRHWGSKARLGKGYPQQEHNDPEIFRGSYGEYGNHGMHETDRGNWRERDRDGYEPEVRWHGSEQERGRHSRTDHGSVPHSFRDPHPFEFNSDWEQADRERRENSASWDQGSSHDSQRHDRSGRGGQGGGNGRRNNPRYQGGYDPYDVPHRGADYRDGTDY